MTMRRIFSIVIVPVCVVLMISGCHASHFPDEQTGIVDDADVVSVTETFGGSGANVTVTQPARPLSFLFFSDTQADPETMDYSGVGGLIAQAVSQNEAVELLVFGGDIVNDGGADGEWNDFRESIGAIPDRLVTLSVPGNHDSRDMLALQFNYPEEAPTERGSGVFYSFSMGPVFFLMLDSDIMGAADRADADWLRDELQSDAARQAAWRIAVMHHPMWPVADIPKDIRRAETMRECFLPIMEEYDVGLILCGHQHVYARTLPMFSGPAPGGGRGIIQVMAASGGKESYVLGEAGYAYVSAPAPNYLLISADSESLAVTAYNVEHSVIDSVVMRK